MMPPETAIVHNKYTGEAVQVRGLDHVLEFLDVEVLGIALSTCGFTQKEYVQRLVEIFRSGNEKESLAAGKELRSLIREVADVNGMIAAMKQTIIDGDKHQEITVKSIAKTRSMIERMNSERPENRIPAAQPRILAPLREAERAIAFKGQEHKAEDTGSDGGGTSNYAGPQAGGSGGSPTPAPADN